jgi:hypothetical protein
MLPIVLIIVRIIIILYCLKRAKELGKNQVAWGLFAFFIPIVALIAIQFSKPQVIVSASEIDDIGKEEVE